jgi:hypothetical protein
VRWVDDTGSVVEPAGGGQFFRGRVDGDPNSWVRLTFRGDALAGVISTDDEMYFLEPASRFFGEEAAHETLAYRLSDTDTGMIPGSCGARAPSTLLRHRLAKVRRSRQAMHELIGNAATSVVAAASGNLLQADVGIVADFSYFSKHGADSANDIAEIINNVDGIYQAQLGVTMRLLRTVVYSTPDPFSTSTDPNTLLTSFSSWRTNNVSGPSAPLSGTDLSHLITARDLNSTVIGIAYIDAVCDNTFGVGVDQDFSTALNMMTLLLSHEMGHNFGAYHDAQSNPACPCCAASPPTFIMNPVISGSLQNAFSDCSKSFILGPTTGTSQPPAIQGFSCLASVPPPPPPAPPTLNPISTPITVGSTTTLTGTGFTAGSQIMGFVGTSQGTQMIGPFVPSSWTPTSLTWNVPASLPLGFGYAVIAVVNTDQGYAGSQYQTALLFGNAALNRPTILGVNGTGLHAPDGALSVVYVSTPIFPGTTVTLTGTGFNGAGVNFYTASGNLGPLWPLPGSTSTSMQLQIPANTPLGLGAFEVVNQPYTGSVASQTVFVPVGDPPTISSISQNGSTITVNGTGFANGAALNFFVHTVGGGMANDGPGLAVTVLSTVQLQFTLPGGTAPGAAYVQVINPPFIPLTSTGNDPHGAFVLQ